MKIYTNKNNTATLKLLIAAKLANKNVEIVIANFGDDVFSGPKQLPLFEVDPHLTFFSSNAATQYLFPTLDLSENRQCQQMQEWEATRLQPAVSALVTSKTVTSELKQTLGVLLEHINTILDKNEYIVGDKLSSADISIWSTLYPLYYNNDLKQLYLLEYGCLMKWYEDLADSKAFQEAVKQWDGSPNGPFGPSAELGAPEMSTFSPGTPEDDVTGPTPEELQTAKDNWQNGFANLQAPLVREKVPQPVKDRKNILITSSLPYVNNVPHLGNIIGCVLSADIFARYCRMCGFNTLYICGTDEYGTATETKAIEERVTPQEICDKYYAIHAEVYKWFNISFDHFGRTTTKEQKEIAQSLFLKLRSNGFISSQTVDQLFCEKCQRFLADRFVEGTCPHPGCLYDNARGDQCDKCGKLINAIDLLEPKCKVCSHKPIVRPSEQLFLDLPQLEPAIRSWVSGVERQWSGPARAVARSWLREPMRSRAITRDLKWGVPVPLDNYRDKVFYVWFDAPIGYLSITQCATKEYEKWWRPSKEHKVKLYQFMAKDNVPFHAIMFPATVIGINEGHLLVEHLFATEYLNYEQGKFSKSRGVGVFGTDVQDTNIPADVWRFYLASVRPEGSDSAFSWKELGQRNNSELLNNLGNFFHRSLTFCSNMYERRLPEIALSQTDYELVALINTEVVAYVNNMEKGRLRDALRHVMAISRLGNQLIQAEQPWVLLKGTEEEQHRAGSVVGFSCQIVALLCILMEPFIPETADKLRDTLNVDKSTLRINPENPSLVQYLPPGHEIKKPTPLFSRIESDTLIALQKKFSGTQSERGEVVTANAKTPKKSQTKKEVGSKSAKESKKEAKGSSTKCEAK